ncbi:hypothetical protein Tco_0261034 [Tanacetum coccineum]
MARRASPALPLRRALRHKTNQYNYGVLVKLSKRRAFWSLNEDILKTYDSDNQYAVSFKEDMAYPCLHSPKTTKPNTPYPEEGYTPLYYLEQWNWNWSKEDTGVRNTTYMRDMLMGISQVDLNAVDGHYVLRMAKD